MHTYTYIEIPLKQLRITHTHYDSIPIYIQTILIPLFIFKFPSFISSSVLFIWIKQPNVMFRILKNHTRTPKIAPLLLYNHPQWLDTQETKKNDFKMGITLFPSESTVTYGGHRNLRWLQKCYGVSFLCYGGHFVVGATVSYGTHRNLR